MRDAARIAQVLGGQVCGRDTVLAPGPGHSPRDRSLAIRLEPSAPDGFLAYSHAGDDWRACRDYVRSRLGLAAWQPGDGQRRTIPQRHVAKWDFAAIEAEAQIPRAMSEDDLLRVNAALRIWNEARDPRGTLAETYLRQHRQLDLPDSLSGMVLRFHPACPWRDENSGSIVRMPALIVPFRSIDTDEITGIHRTALNADGSKIGRRMLGVVHRSAIKVDPVSGDKLAIGEGLETVLAARQLGFAPAWALGSVGAISFFPVVEDVSQLVVLGEAGPASAQAIRFCGKRWRKADRRVRVVMPTAGLSDLNDVLIVERTRP
jgi:Toprim domain-containing protein